MTLTTQILIAMVAGAALGVIIHFSAADVAFVQDVIINGLFEVIGAMFVSALK